MVESKDFLSYEYSTKFDEYRLNRVTLSYYKYGSARLNFGRGYVSALGSMEKAINKYKETKNKEYLCDAANYIMFEFMYPSMPGVYFKATGTEDSAGIDGISIAEMEQLRMEDDLK